MAAALTVAGLALGHVGVLSPVAEGTGKCLVLGDCFFHLFTNLGMAGHTEGPWCGHGIVDLQWMMGRMTAKAVTGDLAFGMGLVALGAVGYLTVDLVTEGTGLLGMGAFIVGKILAWAFMAGEARLFYIISQMQGQRLVRV